MTNSKLSFGLGRGEVWLDLQRSAKERALVKERDSRLQQDNSRLQVPLVFLRKKSARPAILSHVGKPAGAALIAIILQRATSKLKFIISANSQRE